MACGTKPTLAVVYDEGPMPSDLLVALAERYSCVFVLRPNDYAREVIPLLSAFGPVIEVDTVENAARQLAGHAPDGIVTYTEQVLRLTAELAQLLGLPFHSRRTAEVLTDKWQQRAALRAAGVDSIRTARVDSEADWAAAAEHVGFPAVLKPVHGGASTNTYFVEDARSGLDTARRVLATGLPGLVRGGGLVLEEYLRGRPCEPFGDYVSVESVVLDGEVVDLGVTGKLPMVAPFRETGRFWPSQFGPAEDERLRALARRAVLAVGVRYGITHTEIKLTPDGPRVIEVNGRLGGGIQDLALRSVGLDVIDLGARIALGDYSHPKPAEPDRVYYQIFHPAPRQACELLAVEGADAVRALAGVDMFRLFSKPGQALRGGVGTVELGRLSGVVADHAALAAVVEEVGAALRFRFAFDGGRSPVTVTRADLGSL